MASNLIMEAKTNAYKTRGGTVSSSVVDIADLASWGNDELSNAVRAFVTARTAGVMVTWSGDTPTATLGHLIPVNGTIEVLGNENIMALKFIREADTDADVSVTLEG